MLFRPSDQHALKVADRVHRLVARAAHPEPEVSRDLIIARPRGMKSARGRSDQTRRGGARHSCECLRVRRAREHRHAHIPPAMISRPSRIAAASPSPIIPWSRSIDACAFDAAISSRHSSLVEADRRIDSGHQFGWLRFEAPAPAPLRLALRWGFVDHRRAGATHRHKGQISGPARIRGWRAPRYPFSSAAGGSVLP